MKPCSTASDPVIEIAVQPWKVLSRQVVFEAAPYVRVNRDQVLLPDGRKVDDYFRVTLRDYVCIFAETIDLKLLVLRGYKHGPGRTVLSFPAGYVDPGESPAAAARRELHEETGYASESWYSCGSYTINGNQGCGIAHLFLAKACTRISDANPGDLEDMDLLELSKNQLVASAHSGYWALLDHMTLLAIATNENLAAIAVPLNIE